MKKRQLPYFKTWWMCLLMLFVANISIGQISVNGKVTDADDKSALIGVNILVQGTSIGTVTDLDGNYSLNVPDANSVILFSYTGYETQAIPVGNQTVINVALGTGSTIMDEIVVVGYTTRKRGELTGSVSTVNSEDIERTSNKDVAKSLSGKVPGLIVVDRGGFPGDTDNDAMTLLIRGKSTLGNNAPLVLIDGVVTESFSHLAPHDIESLSVLKDGAAAIYGARAANGVILITTKRGKEGKPVINLTSSYSLSSLTANPRLMTSEQYAIYRNEAADRSFLPLPFTQEEIDKYAAGNDPNYPSTDWYAATMADYSPEWRNSLSVSGGTEKINYFISGDYLDQTGLFESGDLRFKQYQLRTNLDIKLHPTLKLGVDLSGRFGNRKEPGVNTSFIYKHIFTNEPTEVDVYPNGLMAWGGENGANPVIMTSDDAGFINRIDNNLRSRLSLDWDLDWLVEGLSAQTYAGIRRWNTDTKTWYTPWTVYVFQEGADPEYVPQLGFSQQGAVSSLRERFWKFDELMLNATIRYDRNFGAHTIKSFVGTERFTSESREFWVQRQEFPSNDRPELFAGNVDGQSSFGGSEEFARLNYFGSIGYDFQKKYFIDFTLRYDGSNRFAPGQRFGTFPGVAVAWSIGNEGFMAGTSNWLDALKLRASWAIMGNDRIQPYQWLTLYEYSSNPDEPSETVFPNYYVFGTPGVVYNGYASTTIPNPDATWETADMKNVGLSFSLLNYRLSGDVNYFYQKREDILITRNASIPQAAGLTLPPENLGKVNNFGWEVQLGWNDKIGKINYNLGVNFTQAQKRSGVFR